MAKPAPKPSTIVIDPLTRVEGHLRIEAQLDASSKVTSALSSGTMVRGVEIILRGRDPRDAWAFTQRNCGVCTWIHALASIRAVENALGITIPRNAQLIRNLTTASWNIPDHWMHFYHLHALDWINLPDALNADAAATANLQQTISSATGSPPFTKGTTAYFQAAKDKLATFVASGQLGIFRGWWDHPAYQVTAGSRKIPATVNLLAFAHYLESLEVQREVIRIHAILGGKNPHPMTLVGGVPCAISVDANLNNYAGGRTALNRAGLDLIQQKITELRNFVDQVYVPDTLAVAAFYPEYTAVGEGLGNFLALGEYPHILDFDGKTGFRFPPGAILGRDLSTVYDVDPADVAQIKEYVAHSWYSYSTGKSSALHPSVGQTALNFTGSVPFTNLNPNADYSWIKSPRWQGNAMEVGPLSRLLIDYARGSHPPTTAIVNYALNTLGQLINIFRPDFGPVPVPLPASVLFSTLGRTAARTLNTKILADMMQVWYDQLVGSIQSGDFNTFNEVGFNPANWPANAKNSTGVLGVGVGEAPRGSVAHWVTIRNSVIDNYQVISPTTWNGSPRDAAGNPGAFEAALPGHTLARSNQPLEILRTIHSFDPCLACAVHVVDPQGEDLVEVKVK